MLDEMEDSPDTAITKENAPVQVIDLRNILSYEQHSFLIPVRQAIICMFDFLVEKRVHSRQPLIGELKPKELVRLALALGLNPEKPIRPSRPRALREYFIRNHRDLLQDSYWLYKATLGLCKTVANGIRLFFSIRYPDEYECYIWGSTDFRNLDYFTMHEIVIIRHIPTGFYIAASPANIFNPLDGEEDLFPFFNGKAFNRITSVLISKQIGPLVQAFITMEGNHSQWGNRTNDLRIEDSFGYLDPDGRPKAMYMSTFINQWEGEDIT